VKLSESLHALGLHTSKVGSYAAPRAKRFAGFYAPLSPVEKPEPEISTA
jgi:allantoin racemase